MGAQTAGLPDHGLTEKQQEILADIRRVAREIGETPSAPKYNDLGEFSAGAVQYHFSSWNDAIDLAGYEPNTVHVDDAEAMEELREWVESLDHIPTKDEVNADGPYSMKVYRRIVGSWNEVLQAIGVEPRREKNIPKERLAADYRRVARELGKRPTGDEYSEHGRYSANPIEDRWDSWANATESIDVPELDE